MLMLAGLVCKWASKDGRSSVTRRLIRTLANLISASDITLISRQAEDVVSRAGTGRWAWARRERERVPGIVVAIEKQQDDD